MGEQWSLINFTELMDSILTGDRSIDDPIDIYNKRRDTLSKISFLNLLLNYNNIDKDNLLEVLYKIFIEFQSKINNLQRENVVQQMVERINNEWFYPENSLNINDPFSKSFFTKNNLNKLKYENSCKKCNKIEYLCKIENNMPLNLKEGDKHPLENNFISTIEDCENSIQYLQNNIQNIEQIISYLNNFNLSLFIDLSIKHKSLYLKIDQTDKNYEIPEKIHKIFSNFIHIHNLLHKQLIQYHQHINQLLDDLKRKCNHMNTLKQNIQSIAYISNVNDEKDEKDEKEKQIIDDDLGQLYVENNKVKIKDNDEQSFVFF